MIINNVCTALVTPFTTDNKIDYPSLKKLLHYQTSHGIKDILLLGTTGESPTISELERAKLISFVKSNIPASTHLIVGTGSNNTATAIRLTSQAKSLGADACLIVTPYYNKCTQQGAIEHYTSIARSVDIPIIIYNVPSRTGFNLSPETTKELFKLPNIVGIKEANSDINHILKLFSLKLTKPIYCGNDDLNYIFNMLGSQGTISVTSNAYPQLVIEGWQNKSLQIHNLLYPLNKLLFVEPNPIPIKYLLNKLGLIRNNLRPPLTKLSQKHRLEIQQQINLLKDYV